MEEKLQIFTNFSSKCIFANYTLCGKPWQNAPPGKKIFFDVQHVSKLVKWAKNDAQIFWPNGTKYVYTPCPKTAPRLPDKVGECNTSQKLPNGPKLKLKKFGSYWTKYVYAPCKKLFRGCFVGKSLL